MSNHPQSADKIQESLTASKAKTKASGLTETNNRKISQNSITCKESHEQQKSKLFTLHLIIANIYFFLFWSSVQKRLVYQRMNKKKDNLHVSTSVLTEHD